jgi:hypothetical protein
MTTRTSHLRYLLAVVATLVIGAVHATAASIIPTLIGGDPVEDGTWREVVYISSGGGRCTATIVGPRVLITAAHCASNNSTVTFTLDGKKYSARITRSSLYPGRDHDIALGLITEEVKDVVPKTIGGQATKGLEITLLGYGCTRSNGGRGAGGNDGILRIGTAVVSGFSGFDMVSTSGAALCFGDSGGPAFIAENGEENAVLLGINSKGDIATTNYNTRLDTADSQSFLKKFASNNGVDICGVNKECKTTPTDPPTCTLTASPEKIKIGESITLLLTSSNATSAEIEGESVAVPSGQRRITPTLVGQFSARARVTGAGGQAECEGRYSVTDDTPPPDRPTCTLTAFPQQVAVGETVTLELVTQGPADFASIDGVAVSIPSGKQLVTTKLLGDFSANGFVRGNGGSSNCFAEYKVSSGGTVPPAGPAYSVTPTACGANLLSSSGIKEVCVGVVKKSESSETLLVQNVVMISNQDGSKEILPVLAIKSIGGMGGQLEEQWTLYANKGVTNQNYQVLDTRNAALVKRASDGQYISLEGRSALGRYFIVDTFSSPAGLVK